MSKKIVSKNEPNQLTIGIDASNLRGGVTHLVELLRIANPVMHGFDRIVVCTFIGFIPIFRYNYLFN